MSTRVHLIGAGPGAPDLLTLRAARLLAEAEVVLHDALVHPDTLALARGAVLIDVGKRSGGHATDQRFINRQLVNAARRFSRVVRLKGGDPMLFGRAQEEIDALVDAGFEVEVVPGVTAALAASAQLRCPLTRRGGSRSVVFATPRVAPGTGGSEWVDAVRGADTLALYMAGREAAATRAGLLQAGWSDATPVALVENASLPDSRMLRGTLADLASLAAQLHDGPAMLLAGNVLADHRSGQSSVRARGVANAPA